MVNSPRADFKFNIIKKWSGRRDSNPRHSPWQGDALPSELLPRYSFINIISKNENVKFKKRNFSTFGPAR